MYFLEIQELSTLETHCEWDSCLFLLKSKIKQDPNNPQLLCRLIAECWYFLSDWDILPNKECIDYSAVKETLIAAYEYGKQNYMDNVNFLWETGYMMSLFPYLFYDVNKEDLFSEYQQHGKKMLEVAQQMCPNDKILRVLEMGVDNNCSEYCEAKKGIQHLIPLYFGEETAIERYFRSCLRTEEER